MDLLLLAYQGDITRVSCLQIGRELSGRTYPWIGVPEAHHGGLAPSARSAQHPAEDQDRRLQHVAVRAPAREDARRPPDGDGTLLDHSLFLYGAGMGDGDRHTPLDLPVVLAGGGRGQLKGGRHLRYAENTPFMNLCVTLLDKVDVRWTSSATARVVVGSLGCERHVAARETADARILCDSVFCGSGAAF